MYLFFIVSSATLALSLPATSFAARGLANSSSTASSSGKLSGFLLINGEDVYDSNGPALLQAASDKLCDPTIEDVYTCAKKKRQSILSPDDAIKTNTVTKLTGPISLDYLSLEYDTEFTKCTVSQPEIISRGELKTCGIDTCSEQFTATLSSTDTHTYGFKVTANAKVGADIKVVKAEVQIGGEFNDAWTNTQVSTTTSTVTRTMKAGDICAWANVQFYVDCKSQIKVKKLAMYNFLGEEKYPDMDNLCTQFNDADRSLFVRGQGFPETTVNQVNEICASTSTSDENGNVRLDLGDGSANARPWSITGCMYS